MKKIFLMVAIIFAIGPSIYAKPKVKLTVGVDLKFGKHSEKDENGECPHRGICKLHLDIGVEPATGIAIPNQHQVAINEMGQLIIIVDKNTLRTDQPDKLPDFKNATYPMRNGNDIIPSEITQKLNINGGKSILLNGDYPINEDNDSYVITLGKY